MKNSSVKVAAVHELDAKPRLVFGSREPVLVTRRGKVSGVYVPLDKLEQIPTEIRRKLAGVVGRDIAKTLRRKKVSGKDIKEDFRAYRWRRR